MNHLEIEKRVLKVNVKTHSKSCTIHGEDTRFDGEEEEGSDHKIRNPNDKEDFDNFVVVQDYWTYEEELESSEHHFDSKEEDEGTLEKEYDKSPKKTFPHLHVSHSRFLVGKTMKKQFRGPLVRVRWGALAHPLLRRPIFVVTFILHYSLERKENTNNMGNE